MASFVGKLCKPALLSIRASVQAHNVRCYNLQAYSQAVVNLPESDLSTLSNGLRVATESMGLRTCTVGVWIESGSRFETDRNHGASNLIDHLAFKGTNKRSQMDLELDVQKIAGRFGSYTSREQTAYFIKCPQQNVASAIEILSDVVLNKKFSDQDIDRERGVILRELEQIEEHNFQEMVMDFMHLVAYQGTPLSKSALGKTDTIKLLQRKDLLDFVDDNYKAPRMVLAAAGGVDHEQISELADKHFGKVLHTYARDIPSLAPCRFTGSDFRFRNDAMPYVHVAIAVETPGLGHPDCIPLMLANTILGSWDRQIGLGPYATSPLAQQIVWDDKIENYQAFHILYKDTGLWGVYSVGDGPACGHVIPNIQKQWKRFTTHATDEQLERAKTQLKTNLLVSTQNTATVCEDIGRQLLGCGRRISFQELDAQIDACTVDTFKDACMQHIYDRCPVISAMGQTEALALSDYIAARQGMSWWRM